MAAAAYNASPGRPRTWRNGPLLEAAAWAESIPFDETRDYVKKVLSNATAYAALISGQPQSLKARLGQIGPRDQWLIFRIKRMHEKECNPQPELYRFSMVFSFSFQS